MLAPWAHLHPVQGCEGTSHRGPLQQELGAAWVDPLAKGRPEVCRGQPRCWSKSGEGHAQGPSTRVGLAPSFPEARQIPARCPHWWVCTGPRPPSAPTRHCTPRPCPMLRRAPGPVHQPAGQLAQGGQHEPQHKAMTSSHVFVWPRTQKSRTLKKLVKQIRAVCILRHLPTVGERSPGEPREEGAVQTLRKESFYPSKLSVTF